MRSLKFNPACFLIIVTCCLLVGCIRNGVSGSSANDQKGFIHADAEGVLFLQWTKVDNKLNGQMSAFFVKGAREKTAGNSSHAFEGVSDGKNISINFTGSQWTDALGGRTWTGTISGSDLTLVIPSNNGTLLPVEFTSGSVEQYNQAVAEIRNGVQQENKRTQQEKSEAAKIQAEKNAVIEGNNRVRSSLNALSTGMNAIESSMKFESVLADYVKTWDKMKGDHKNLTEKAAQKSLTSYEVSNAQYLLSTLRYDLETFDAHSSTFDYYLNQLNEAVKSVKEAQGNVKESWQRLQLAIAANSTGVPGSEFSDADISQLIRASDEKIQQASQATRGFSQRRVQYHNQASDLYRKDEALVKSLKAVD